MPGKGVIFVDQTFRQRLPKITSGCAVTCPQSVNTTRPGRIDCPEPGSGDYSPAKVRHGDYAVKALESAARTLRPNSEMGYSDTDFIPHARDDM
jgi:hypothetical protein